MTEVQDVAAAHLDSFARTSSEVIAAESDLLLRAEGLPWLSGLSNRPVLAVADVPGAAAKLRKLRRFIRQHRPLVIADASAVPLLKGRRLRPAVLVFGAHSSVPAMRGVTDAVLCAPAGVRIDAEAALSGAKLRVHRVVSSLAPFDVLVLAARGASPSVIVTVDEQFDLAHVIDAARESPVGTYVARLAVADRAIGSAALAEASRPSRSPWRALARWSLALVLAAAFVAVGAAGWARFGTDSDSSSAPALTPSTPTVPTQAAVPQPSAAPSSDALASLAPTLVQGRLSGQNVALVVIAGAPTTSVDSMTSLLTAAGAHLDTYIVPARAFDPAAQTMVAALADQLAPSATASIGAYQQFGTAVGSALASATAAKSFTTKQDGDYRALTGASLLSSATRHVGAQAGLPATSIVLLTADTDASATSFAVGLSAQSKTFAQTSGDTAANVEAIIGLG